MNLDLLLAHADDHEPALEGGFSADSALGMDDPGDPRGSAGMRHDGADPNALPLQRWGVIAPGGPEGDRLLALIEPLIRARREDQGGAPVRTLRVPPNMSAADARAFRASTLRAVKVEEQPRYLLMLGDLDRVSLDLQQVLSADAFVGRLAFRRDEDYAAYVDKLLRCERAPAAAKGSALFSTVRDGTQATTTGDAALMQPVRERCCEQQALGSFSAEAIEEIPAEELLGRVASKTPPSALFSMSHGLGAPRDGWASSDAQRALQGALRLGRGSRIAAEDFSIGGRAFLPGGVWLFFACFSAGTPSRSAYYAWLRRLRVAQGQLDGVLASLPREGDRPFVAALPQAVLANPEGPLAVVGHVDLAWTYSFMDAHPGGGRHAARFYAILRALLDGLRVGVAHAEITRFFLETSVDLSTFYDEDAQGEAWDAVVPADPQREVQKALLWMRRHDLAGFVLLGDPAARLPIALGAPERVARPAEVGVAEEGEEMQIAEVARMEEAVLAMLRGGEAEETIATRAGVSAGELERWVEAYREAGRERLGRERRAKS